MSNPTIISEPLNEYEYYRALQIAEGKIEDQKREIERLREAWRDRGDVIDLLQRKLMHLHNFPSHPGGHKDDHSNEAMVPEDWRHGWICAVEAMQEAVVNHSLTTASRAALAKEAAP